MSQRITKVLGLIALTGLSSLMSAQTMDWKPAGPVYNAGRARNMVVDRLNSQVMYVGSSSSGIFKSTDAGINWDPINDQATIRNISYLAQAYDGTIYAGTGEGFLRPGQKTKAQPGTGLYRLNESTSPPSLVQVASNAVVGNVINRVACNPNNSTHIALATNLGIMVSTNGGASFNVVTLPSAPTGSTVTGQDVKFDANGILYCSIGTESGTSTLTASQVYKSSDATSLSSFSKITPQSNVLVDMNYGRIELAVAASSPNVVYASCSNKYLSPSTASLKGLFVSYDAGATWGLILQGSPQLDPLSNGGTRASGDYAHVITVSPTNPNALFFGGYSFYVFIRTGGANTNPIGNWISVGQSFLQGRQDYLHENIHDIKLIQGSPDKLYFVTDAGVYRSIDIFTSNNTTPPSFQAFYKGMITGQFNSVSIERYPIGDSLPTTRRGMQVTPFSGFIGGTGGNGLTYFSGTYSLVTTELNHLSGEVYSSEYSKILPNAAFASVGTGGIFRSSNIKTSAPTILNINRYFNPLSRISPDPFNFPNVSQTTGTPFKLWENYGQVTVSPDSMQFYNDTTRYPASMTGVQELTTKTTFTFATTRPNKFAIIDSVVIRTGTVALPISNTSYTGVPLAFTAADRIAIKARTAPTEFTSSATSTVLISHTTTQGPAAGPLTFSLNPASLTDNISVTFLAPPFGTKTVTQYPPTATGTAIIVPDAAVYYRVFCTVFYKYPKGAEVTVVDNNISTRTTGYTAILSNDLNWRYGPISNANITASVTPSVPSPTYVLSNGTASTNPTFTVPGASPGITNVYSISTLGTYTLNAVPVVYTIAAVPNSSVTPPLVYSISPGSYTQTSNVFTVVPTGTAATAYTITESGSNTVTVDTYSTVGTATYVITSTSVSASQSGTAFVVTPSVSTNYTIQGVSSNTLAGANTQTVYNVPVIVQTFTVGNSSEGVPFAPNNKPFRIANRISARLAFILNNTENTGSQDAIVVSKNPLALNDPLSLVRVSQTGAYSDNIAGAPTTSITTTIVGKPILLEWSKGGTEIYFATNANKVYRVSHITTLMDLSPSSYGGKFYTDIFKYAAPVNATTPNKHSPYRTTLIGSFDKPVTSISVANDDQHIAVTFNSTSTGTTATVMYSKNSSKVSDQSNIAWESRQGTLPSTVAITYCSLTEKSSNTFFLGTENGMYYTDDISATNPTWMDVNNNTTSKLPKVQIFDIKQQTFAQWDCYNSGQIYVATNGRGVWTTGKYLKNYTVGVDEVEKRSEGKNLSLYPNPTNGNVNIVFDGYDGETATIQVMDISGRLVQSEDLGKLGSGEINHSFSTNALNSGVYIVNISSDSGVKRVTKLIVTK